MALLPATFLAWSVSPASASVIRVPQDYPTIQAAVDAARAGDTIQVANGTYYENVVVSERVTIVGESNTNTIVDGDGKDVVFNVEANNVEIRQFTIRNGGKRYSGIDTYLYGGFVIRDNRISQNVVGINLAESDGNTIDGNILFDNSMYGISLAECDSNTIENNNIANSAYGIDLQDSSGGLVAGNTVSDTSYGIYLAYVSNIDVSANTLTDNSWNMYLVHADGNTVDQNTVSGGSVGIEVYWSQGNSITDNTATESSYGIYLAHCGANTLTGNTASLNDWGIELYNSTGSTIIENMISDNTWGAYVVENSDGNSIYHNNFMDNVKGAYQDLSSSNTWRTPTTPYQGNYWSDYKGVDLDEPPDGIGDTYLPWEGVDYYPLMAPWGITRDVAIVSVTPSATQVYVGRIVNITVVIRNEGMMTENFNVTAKYENVTGGIAGTIGTQTVPNLAPDANVTLTFSWNTTDMTACYSYTIKAEASVVPGETDTSDNIYVDGNVKVKMLADVDGNGEVNLEDLMLIARALGTDPRYPPGTDWDQWNPQCDLDGNNKVDAYDMYIAGKNYGKTC